MNDEGRQVLSYPERPQESVNGTGGTGIPQSKVEKQGGEVYN